MPKIQSNPLMLQPGALLGQRYEILQILGEGGMGAVYKARDRELNRMVALKVIRPELAGSQAIIDRFKQELLLAHQVTHKNVIRIYDLSEADGLKFITMEYVEGEDLRGLMQQKTKLAPGEAVEIMLQVCRALEAAHSAGIIHRDLKPQNIMRDKTGRILVMDFGLARTLEGDGMTQTGALIGTMDYMSPEQALGKELDQRSDLFTLGLIFYELLTGKMPYKADSAVASLLKRTQERAAPVSSHDASIPRPLSDIVSRCMDPDPKLRYESSSQIMADLEAWQGGRAAATLHFPSSSKPWGQTVPWPWIGGIAAALLLAVIGFIFRAQLFTSRTTPSATGPVVSLAVIPFRNASGDPGLDWIGGSLAEMLTTDVGQSSQLRLVSSDRMHQLLQELRISSDTSLDEATLRRLSDFSGANQLVWGQYAKFGDHIRIDATLRDLKQQRTVPLKAEAPNEKGLLEAVDQLAHSIQGNLALSAEAVKELQATAFTPSTKSPQALRFYNEGIQLLRQGNNLEASKRLEACTKEDPEFALAYSRLGQTYAGLGYDDKALDSSRKAVDLSQGLPSTERYVILANHAVISRDNQKAIDSYEKLAKASPNDSELELTLAKLYEDSGSFDTAREHLAKIVTRDPSNLLALLAAGRVEIKRRNAGDSLGYLNRALTLAVQVDNQQAKANVLYTVGLAYKFLNKPDEALRNQQESLAIRRHIGDQRGIAASLNEIAEAQMGLGKSNDALKNYQAALQLRREIGDRKGTGSSLINLGNFYSTAGQDGQALKFYKESLQIQRDLGDPASEASCLQNIGGSYHALGQYDDALTYFQQALLLLNKLNVPEEVADTLHNVGETYVKMGDYDQALDYYHRALDIWRAAGNRRNTAIESDSMGTIFEYQGRYGAALSAKEEAVKTLRDIGERGFWLTAIVGSYGNALAEVGRFDEGQKNLDEALSIAREIHSDPMVSRALNFQGDRFLYAGDIKTGKSRFQEALAVARRAKEREQELVASQRLGRIAIDEGRYTEAIAALRRVVQDADGVGMKYVSLGASVDLADAFLHRKDYPAAGRELTAALPKCEKVSLRVLQAKIHYLLSIALGSSGQASDAARHLAQTRQIMEDIRKEARSDDFLKRADLKPILELVQTAAKQ
jgi:serine/threonine protein kinase/tetratricopeptide (TPR) repeat protein